MKLSGVDGGSQPERIFIFGYGSLINPRSIPVTLGRKVETDELIVSTLRGWERRWRCFAEVVFLRHGRRTLAFLDVRKAKDTSCVGVSIEVTRQELEAMDDRELFYRRVDVSAGVWPPLPGRVFTYSCQGSRMTEPTVAAVSIWYTQIIEAGLRYWGRGFTALFEASTVPHQLELIGGKYRFLEERQNRATGRI